MHDGSNARDVCFLPVRNLSQTLMVGEPPSFAGRHRCLGSSIPWPCYCQHSFSVCCPVLAWSQEKEKEHGGWELLDTYEPTTSNHKQPEKCILAVDPGRKGYGDWLVGFAPEYGTVFSPVINWTTSSTPSYTKMMETKTASIILMC